MREFSLAVRKRVHAAAPPVALKQVLRKFVRTKAEGFFLPTCSDNHSLRKVQGGENRAVHVRLVLPEDIEVHV